MTDIVDAATGRQGKGDVSRMGDVAAPRLGAKQGRPQVGGLMTPARIGALTDAVVAIVLTIMGIQLNFPAEPTLQSALRVLPLLGAYLFAFMNVAIFWNNLRHMMNAARKVTGGVLWANHALLFWLTLFPRDHPLDRSGGDHVLAGGVIRACALRRGGLVRDP